MLRDIKDAGGLDNMSFVDICDGDVDFYGKPNSEKRSYFQKKVNLLKRMKPSGYLKRLQDFKVKPSDASKERTDELEEDDPTPTFTDINDLNDIVDDVAGNDDEEFDPDDVDDVDDDEDDDDKPGTVHDLAAMLSGLGLNACAAGSGKASGPASLAGGSRASSRAPSLTPPRSRKGSTSTPPRKALSINVKELKLRTVRGAYGNIGQPTTAFVGTGINETFVGSKTTPQRIDVNLIFPNTTFHFLLRLFQKCWKEVCL